MAISLRFTCACAMEIDEDLLPRTQVQECSHQYKTLVLPKSVNPDLHQCLHFLSMICGRAHNTPTLGQWTTLLQGPCFTHWPLGRLLTKRHSYTNPASRDRNPYQYLHMTGGI
jgi:hypothetical protein